jgi:large subunit ribosomal protein L20
MPRVKRGVMHRKRVNKIMKEAKGYKGARSRRLKQASEQLLHSRAYAYRDRKVRKRDMRSLWIVRINAAARVSGLSYSRLMDGLKKAGVEVNRKILADLAVTDNAAFARLAEMAKAQLTPA